jgi:hypothetical protein
VEFAAGGIARMVTTATTTAILWGSRGRVVGVVYVPNEPGDKLDCAFSLLREDAPDEPQPDTPNALVCLDCALDEWPGIGRGLDLAREHGSAELAGGWGRDRGRQPLEFDSAGRGRLGGTRLRPVERVHGRSVK